jgi:hypothetical protein
MGPGQDATCNHIACVAPLEDSRGAANKVVHQTSTAHKALLLLLKKYDDYPALLHTGPMH